MLLIKLLILLVLTLIPFVKGHSSAVPHGTYQFSPASHTDLELRHCDFVTFATPTVVGNQDFIFNVIPGLNGNPQSYSIQSTNYPDHYLTIDASGGPSRLGIDTSPDVNNASFLIVPGLSNPSQYSIQSLSSGSYKGFYVSLDTVLTGSCATNFKSPSGNVILTDGANKPSATWILHYSPPPPPPTVSIFSLNATHTVNPLFMGCHSDSGYTHQPRGFYSQMIFGESFEEKWNAVVDSGVNANFALDASTPFNNKPSMKFTFTTGNGFAGLSNRGLGNEGLVFSGTPTSNYEVTLYILSPNGATVTARIDDYTTNKVLASKTTVLPKSTTWTPLKFDLTPSASTSCLEITPRSDPAIDCGNMGPEMGHVCVRCAGQFTVGLSAPGTIHVGYVFLQPGSWGRFKDLPVLLSAVQTLQSMGITIIRQGGTFSQTIVWKDWYGPPTQRASMQHKWGASLVSGWGPFEMIDLCNAAGWTIILTLSEDQTPQDWADLLEYCYGGANTTWGNRRISEGHTAPYDIHYFELGNEQYNNNWVDQVKAMEDKAVSMNMGRQFYYIFPTNDGLSANDAKKAQSLGIPVENIMPDIHIGAGGAVEVAESVFNKNPSFQQSAINCETNAGSHDQDRALLEAIDLNDWFNTDGSVGVRLKARTASFCMERSGHYDAFDQGISFFLPHMTWLQPPGYVHQMISQTWQPLAVSFNGTNLDNSHSFSAQKSSNGATLVARFVNNNSAATTLAVTLNGFVSHTNITVWTLSATSPTIANTPSEPTRVSPVKSIIPWKSGQEIPIPAYSFNVIQFDKQNENK